MAKNERKTENVVRDELRELGYNKKPTVVEEQRSEIESVKRLMKAASKSGARMTTPRLPMTTPNG